MEVSVHDDCIFCRIVAGKLPAAVIHEDSQVIAIMDAFPSVEGHALVIPKAHHRDVLELPEADVQAAAVLAKRIAQAQKTALGPDGIVVTQFNGAAAGQTIFHYHVHVVPRWEGQEVGIHGRAPAAPEALAAMAGRLRQALVQ